MRTTGNAVFINRVVNIFQMRSYVKWYVSFGKVSVFTKGITSEQNFVKLNSIKSGIAKKRFWINQRMLVKEIF